MKFLNIGIPEIILLFVITFLILGPGEITGLAKKLGAWIRKVTKSSLWKDIITTSNEIRDLPNKLIREADLENEISDIKEYASTNSILNDELLEVNKEIDNELANPEINNN